MQMAYSEDELDDHMDVLDNSDVVPHMLHDDDLRPEDIIYNGDLKKKDLEGFAKQFDETGKKIKWNIIKVNFYVRQLFLKMN